MKQTSSKWRRCVAWAISGDPILPIGIDASLCAIITENDIDGFIINKYDPDLNKWLHINKQGFNESNWSSNTHSITVDVKQQKIWALHVNGHLAGIPMRDEMISIQNFAINFEHSADLIIIDSKLHAIKYDDNRMTYLKWNEDINTFYEVSKSSIIDISMSPRWNEIHHDPQRNVIQIFSYWAQNRRGFSHCFFVFECCVVDINSWTHYSVELPDGMQEVENASIAINNQGILLYETSGTIWIYCIKSKTIKKSEITIPIKFPFLVTTIDMNYINKNKYIVSGYVRNTCKILNIEEMLLPVCILKLITTYHLYEFVHVMNQLEHQKIRTIDILSVVQ
eukprot:239123_1